MKRKANAKAGVLAAAVMLGLSFAGTASAEPAIIRTPTLTVETDTRIVTGKGSVQIPLRDLAKGIGADLKRNPSDGKLILRKWNRTYTFTVGSRQYDDGMNTKPKPQLDEPVRFFGGRAYIEASFLRVMGYEIGYGGGTLTIASPLGKKTRETLYQGDLPAARQAAMNAARRYEQKELPPKTLGEGYGYTYLFPEGEALRFYVLHGDVASFVEFKDDYAVVTAQGHFSEDANGRKQVLSGGTVDTVGVFPKIDKPFFVYETFMFGVSESVTCSRIELGKEEVLLGRRLWIDGELNQDDGKIVYAWDGEKRTDHR